MGRHCYPGFRWRTGAQRGPPACLRPHSWRGAVRMCVQAALAANPRSPRPSPERTLRHEPARTRPSLLGPRLALCPTPMPTQGWERGEKWSAPAVTHSTTSQLSRTLCPSLIPSRILICHMNKSCCLWVIRWDKRAVLFVSIVVFVVMRFPWRCVLSGRTKCHPLPPRVI